MIGPVLFTMTFSNFIKAHRDWRLPGAPFLLAALLMTAALVLAWRVTSRRSEIKLRSKKAMIASEKETFDE